MGITVPFFRMQLHNRYARLSEPYHQRGEMPHGCSSTTNTGSSNGSPREQQASQTSLRICYELCKCVLSNRAIKNDGPKPYLCDAKVISPLLFSVKKARK